MKLLKLFIGAIMLSSVCNAQTKKAPVKKPVAKTVAQSKPAEEKTPLDAATAGKYAKQLGNKMYHKTNFEPEKGNFSMSINRWKPLSTTKEDGSKQYWYMIDVTIRWQSSQGGWPVQWKNVEYNGVILSDEFGCDVNFIIKSKTEPDRSGLAALVIKKTPTGDLSDDQKQLFEGTDDWFNGVQHVWNPGGCLE